MFVCCLYEKKWHIWKDGGVVGTMRGYTVEPEEMPIELFSILDSKTTNRIYMWDLSYYKDDMYRLLYHSGYDVVLGNPNIKDMDAGTYKTLVSHLGDCYHITVKTGHKTSVRIYDAKKIIPLYRIDDVVKSFGDPKNINPAAAICNAIDLITADHDGMTISGIARRSWSCTTRHEVKELVCDMNDIDFLTDEGEVINADDYIRPAYHGGFCDEKRQASPTYYGRGICLDVNSLYPYEMKKPMPIDKPIYHTGEPQMSDKIAVDCGTEFIYMRIGLKANLKPGHIPCITATGSPQECSYEGGWIDTVGHDGYYYDEHGIKHPKTFLLQLTITYQEWQLIQEQYDIVTVEFIDYITFKTSNTIFKSYIDKWYKEKQKNDKNKGRRKVAKMMENGLSGSFARTKKVENFDVVYDRENDRPKYILTEMLTKNPSYIHIGAAITALARIDIIRAAQKHYDRWIYTDTDSLFLTGEDIPDDIAISDRLGDYKVDKVWDSITFLKKKTYGYMKDGRLNLTVAGVSGTGKELMLKYLNNEIGLLPQHYMWACKVQRQMEAGEKFTAAERKTYYRISKELHAFFEADHSDPLKELRNWPAPTLIRQHDGEFSEKYVMQWNYVEKMNDYIKYY